MSLTPGSDPQRWARVREVLEAALERPEDERGSYVDGACGSDRALRAEIESLLAYGDRADEFLASHPSAASVSSSSSLVGRSGDVHR